ncbi:hypothetical protein OF83DRAFT_1287889 [Amylostereum chailletii]|nr:hypothetical protein OF83DRAFT_1287889 [Amylostereum chailletii]
MPETREAAISGMLVKEAFESTRLHTSWKILNLLADATVNEMKRFRADSRFRRLLVDRIPSNSTFKRGSKNGTWLYPPMLSPGRRPGIKKATFSLQDLELRGVHITNRGIELDLGPLWCQVQLLTHMSPQVYPRKLWESFMEVPHNVRKFHVGIAFECEEYILAFLSRDLVFQVYWEYTRDDLPRRINTVNIIKDWPLFLQGIVDWLVDEYHGENRIDATTTVSATDAIRAAPAWVGVGGYTVNELMHIAGLHPYMNIREVVDNPSRVARLCLALFSFVEPVDTIWREDVKPQVENGVLSPSLEARLGYRDRLHVHMKERCHIPYCMKSLVSSYDVDSDTCSDFYEPSLTKAALTAHPEMGALVFGIDEWTNMAANASMEAGSWDNDVLFQHFKSIGLLDTPKRLNATAYSPRLFLPEPEVKKSWVSTHACRFIKPKSSKVLWTVIQPPISLLDFLNIYDTTIHSFKETVLASRDVAIGPLEYCGTTIPIGVLWNRDPSQSTLPSQGAVVHNIPSNLIECATLSIERRGSLKKGGKEHGFSLTTEERTARRLKLNHIATIRDESSSGVDTPEPESALEEDREDRVEEEIGVKHKKRRRTADSDLIQDDENVQESRWCRSPYLVSFAAILINLLHDPDLFLLLVVSEFGVSAAAENSADVRRLRTPKHRGFARVESAATTGAEKEGDAGVERGEGGRSRTDVHTLDVDWLPWAHRLLPAPPSRR